MRIDGYKLGVALAVLFGVFAALLFLGLPALGAGGDCKTYHNHNGHLPDEYDYGVFIEYRPAVNITSTHSENPRDYGAGRTWDIVKKCKNPVTTTTAPTTTTTAPTTTTTLTEMTTSTVDTTTTTAPTTTTTTPALSSTTMPPTTTTQPGVTTTSEPPASTTTTGPTSTTVPDVSASWSAWAECGGSITVEWGDGVAAVDVYMWFDISLGEAEAGWHQVARYDQPGAYSTPVASRTTFLLIPVTVTGYEVTPMEREVTLEPCQASSTSVPEAPEMPVLEPTDPPGTLPHTGPVPVMAAILVGASLVAGGTALIRWARA